jgi:hypothetical protein
MQAPWKFYSNATKQIQDVSPAVVAYIEAIMESGEAAGGNKLIKLPFISQIGPLPGPSLKRYFVARNGYFYRELNHDDYLAVPQGFASKNPNVLYNWADSTAHIYGQFTALQSQTIHEWLHGTKRHDMMMENTVLHYPREDVPITATRYIGPNEKPRELTIQLVSSKSRKQKKTSDPHVWELGTKCSWCKVGAAVGVCGGCKRVQYCDDNCQKKDWEANHKLICN